LKCRFIIVVELEPAVSYPSNGIGELFARAETSVYRQCRSVNSTCKQTYYRDRLRDNNLFVRNQAKDATTCMNESKWRQPSPTEKSGRKCNQSSLAPD
jgi:hypothetical protein